MEKKLYIGNWKSHKTSDQTRVFWQQFAKEIENISLTHQEVVVCPSFTALGVSRELIRYHALPVKLGSQDISPFPEGAYTGEVAGSQLKELADYVIIGHSERRNLLNETDKDVEEKVTQAKAQGLIPVVCVQGSETPIPAESKYVAYEPVTAIGTGNPDSPENIAAVFSAIHRDRPDVTLLYGGSVNEENVKNFMHIPLLSGFLIGGASLDPGTFARIIQSHE